MCGTCIKYFFVKFQTEQSIQYCAKQFDNFSITRKAMKLSRSPNESESFDLMQNSEAGIAEENNQQEKGAGSVVVFGWDGWDSLSKIQRNY